MFRRIVLPLALASALLVLVASPAAATFPGDNGEILYLRFDETFARASYRTVMPDGSVRTEAPIPLEAITPSWSPDGSMLAYTRVDGGTARLFVHDVTTDERTRVLTGEDVPGEPWFLDEAAFGPTGDRLVFCAVFNRRSELYVVDVDGSDLVLISGDRSLCDPDWSSTDRIVAAVEERRLFTLDPDGSDVELLVKLERPKDPGKGATLDPSWSPDGSTVAFPSSAGQLRSDVWLIDGDGTDLRRFTDSRNRWEFGGQWAPDGSAIAFAQGGRRFLSLTDLWVKPLSGGRDRLTDTPRFDEFIESWRPVD